MPPTDWLWGGRTRMQVLRFAIVAVLGVILDIGIAYALSSVFGFPLWLAATIGFSLAALANYVAHEFWTFRHAASRISVSRAGQYILTSAITLMIRLGAIALLGPWLGAQHKLLILATAAGTSFAVGFVFSKFVIFSNRHDGTKVDR
jgi:putative flippase GtrA